MINLSALSPPNGGGTEAAAWMLWRPSLPSPPPRRERSGVPISIDRHGAIRLGPVLFRGAAANVLACLAARLGVGVAVIELAIAFDVGGASRFDAMAFRSAVNDIERAAPRAGYRLSQPAADWLLLCAAVRT